MTGAPKLLPRLEGLVVLATATAAYGRLEAGWGMFAEAPLLAFGLIWAARIGLDRALNSALGYGLKYADGFGFSHLGPIGNGAATPKPPA